MLRRTNGLIGSRVASPEAEVLAAWEIFPGETLLKLVGQIVCFSSTSQTINKFSEIDFYMLYVPYSVWYTYLDDDDDLDTNPDYPASWSDLHNRWEQILFDYEQTGSNYYGGADPDVAKVGTNVALSDTDSVSDDLVASDVPGAGIRFMGPIGIVRLASLETMLAPWGADGIGRGRHSLSFQIDKMIGISNPGVVLFGLRRSSVPAAGGAQNDWNSLNKTGINGRISALNRLRGGDVDRTRQGLLAGGQDWCNQAAGILFGSDYSIVDDDIWYESSDSESVIDIAGKWSAFYSTPYTLTNR